MTDARAAQVRVYRAELPVRFTHCDPAGIVFYPRYFEMFNDLVEDWCREGLHFPFPEIINRRGWGLPTVRLEVDFVASSTFGEVLTAQLVVRTVGKSSIGIEIVLAGQKEDTRVRGRVVLVLTDRRTGKAIPLPDELRSKILEFKHPDATH
jgi:4-hydroxybenzoyl-CoA thioesterase